MPAKERIELAGAAVGVLRSALLVGAVLAVLIQPSLLLGLLERAGVEEFEFFGAKGKTRLNQVVNRLEEANQAKGKLEVQLKETSDALNAAIAARDRNAGPPTRGITPEAATRGIDAAQLARLQEQNSAALLQAEATRAQAQTTLANNRLAITQARRVEAPPAGRYLVIYSSDPTLAAARDTGRAATALGYDNTRIYFRNGFFASTLEFQSRAEADAALLKARSINRYARDAYVRPIDTWCPGAVQRADGVIECQA